MMLIVRSLCRVVIFKVEDNKLLTFCYNLKTKPAWNDFLFIISWIYMGLAIFEPTYSGDDSYYEEHPSAKYATLVIEAVIILIYLFELFIDIYQRKFDTSRTFKTNYITNKKMVSKVLIDLVLVVDYICLAVGKNID